MGGYRKVAARQVIANVDLSPEAGAWAASRGFIQAERISGGRNNRIFKLCGDSGPAALKVYYRGLGDNRDRFAAERSFYNAAAARGVSAPQWLDADERLGLALLGWIEGDPVGSAVAESHLIAAAEFVVGINEPAPADDLVPFQASEACFSVSDHLALLDRRISTLHDAAHGSRKLREFLGATLSPYAARVRQHLENAAEGEFNSTGWRRIVSPGDFGLHNALRDENGKIVFFDFEYSGWDDPVKTVADVFLQPEKPVDWKFLSAFCAKLHMWAGLEKRVRVWLPFFAAKWAVILLSPVAKDAAERRRFAGETTDEATIERQIAKAQKVIQRGNEFLQ